MIEETGCDYVLVGRGALGKPYIFRQINDYLKTGEYHVPSSEEHVAYFFKYLELAKKHGLGFSHVKTHAMYFTTGLPHAPKLRDLITRCKTVSGIKETYEQIFA